MVDGGEPIRGAVGLHPKTLDVSFEWCYFWSTYNRPWWGECQKIERLPRPLWFRLAECCNKQKSRSDVNRSATAHLLIPSPGRENLRETHLPLWWSCRRERTSWSFLCQKRGTFLEAPQPWWVAVNRSNCSGRKDRGWTFWSNCRDRMECSRILLYLLYGSIASLPSPNWGMAIWHVAPLRFAHTFRALGVCEHIWLRYKNFDPSCFNPIQKFGMSTWGLTLIFDPVRSTYFRPPNLNTLVKQALSTIKVSSILEPIGLTRTDGKRPDGITLAPWEEGKQLVWDVTCVDLLAPSRIENGSVANPGTAAEDADELKTDKYVCSTDKGYIFQPLALEIQGGVGPFTSTFFKNLCKKLCVFN